ncbi:hypothetical protein RTP6_004054 [Batrachochytrium dendrobatidis]
MQRTPSPSKRHQVDIDQSQKWEETIQLSDSMNQDDITDLHTQTDVYLRQLVSDLTQDEWMFGTVSHPTCVAPSTTSVSNLFPYINPSADAVDMASVVSVEFIDVLGLSKTM